MSKYQKQIKTSSMVREQLRLFAHNQNSDSAAESSGLLIAIHGLSKRERLAALLEGELDFHGENSSYASHDLHAFAAKFPPQLPRTFIRGLTEPGDIVLDPMMGSGTTIVEALLEGRRGIGVDIDPLASLLTQVKTRPVEIAELQATGQHVLSLAHSLLLDSKTIEKNLNDRFDTSTKEFIDYWFLPHTQTELMALVLSIQGIEGPFIRRFLELTFSSIIVTKSGGVSIARDLAHTRPHRVYDKSPKNAINQFSIRFRKNLASITQLQQLKMANMPLAGDAKRIPIANCAVDLIVTSPPYANAIDYMRAHKFSLVWLGESVAQLSSLRARYIGSERVNGVRQRHSELPQRAELIIGKIDALDNKKALILRKYFLEMKQVISEIRRVLKPDSVAVIVVGTSTMRGINVQTHSCLADIATMQGFEVVDVVQRSLDRNKRMMPARFGQKLTGIEQRMHEEYVIGLYKDAGNR